jgi:hypothetical protein
MSSDPNLRPDELPIPPRGPASVYRDPKAAVPGSQRLEEDERHPVIIFGSSQAGKSTLIMSIINALEKSGKDGDVGVEVSFGSSFYAKRDGMAQAQMDLARNFYDAASTNFIIGREALFTTQVEYPFFIPLDLRIRGSGLKPVKIALMDGRGEWYEPVPDGAAPFHDLQKYIVEVLKNYSRGMSVICVAPYSLGSTDEDNVQNSDAGLWAALTRYQELRSESDDDALLFLLTKWDQAASPGKDPEFTDLEGGAVAEVAARRYVRSWNLFRNIRVGGDEWEKRCFMQFSACRFIEGRPSIPPDLQDEFLRYPRTVINWIYGNARRFEFTVGRYVTELPLNLFPDVIPRDTKIIPLSERFLRRLVR